MMISCATGVDRLMDYLEDVLPLDVRVAVEAHVDACPRCASFIESYRETPRVIRRATDATLLPEQRLLFRAALRRRVDAPHRP